MHLSLTRHVAALTACTALTVAACSASDNESHTASSATPNATAGQQTTATASITARPTSTISSTSVSETSELRRTQPTVESTTSVGTNAPSTVRESCDATGGPIATQSGRTVVLRPARTPGPAPTLLVIHGFTGTPSGIERVADLTEAANSAGITVAYPRGTAVSPGGFGWSTGAEVFATVGVDDVEALAEMIDSVVATGCVDRDRITVTGESNGAGMTLAALCSPRLQGAFRSAVMVIPAIDEGVLERCAGNGAPETPLAVVIGLIDTTAPVDGGNGLLPQRAWFDRVAAWRSCSDVTERGPLTPWTELTSGTDCRTCTELFTVSDNPHTWPGTAEGNAGSTPGTFDLNRRIIADVLAASPGCLSQR